ncbi:hypothetical protein BSKO_02586 [Bryopsis sp. KO-2023]|nr:hypothetical protein BSKO_02586 [Bryopsis sp. KO-2023]
MRCKIKRKFASTAVQTKELEQRHAKTQTQVEQRSKRTQTTAPAVALEGSGAGLSFRRVDKKERSKGKKKGKNVEKKSRKGGRPKACSKGPTTTFAFGETSIPTEVAVRSQKRFHGGHMKPQKRKSRITVGWRKTNAFHPTLGESIELNSARKILH